MSSDSNVGDSARLNLDIRIWPTLSCVPRAVKQSSNLKYSNSRVINADQGPKALNCPSAGAASVSGIYRPASSFIATR